MSSSGLFLLIAFLFSFMTIQTVGASMSNQSNRQPLYNRVPSWPDADAEGIVTELMASVAAGIYVTYKILSLHWLIIMIILILPRRSSSFTDRRDFPYVSFHF